jgi:uncharacterized protein (TIGR02246 family)
MRQGRIRSWRRVAVPLVVTMLAVGLAGAAWAQAASDDSGDTSTDDSQTQPIITGPGAAESAGSPFDTDTAVGPVTVDPQQLESLFSAAVNSGDVDAVAALYAPDAMLMLPTGETATGRAAIRAVYAANQKSGTNTMAFDQAKVDGDFRSASLVWTWTLTISPQAGMPQRTRGRSLLYLKRTGTTWQIAADMFQAVAVR